MSGRLSGYVAVQNLLRRFESETGELPTAITLPPPLFRSLWSDARAFVAVEHRPGFFTEGFEPMDAGNPVIEMFVERATVRIRCSEPIYQRTLESRSDG